MQIKNENNLSDMCDIMGSFNPYIPAQISADVVTVNGKDHVYDSTKLMKILFFGDQLTAARARGAAILREPQKQKLDRLEGFIPAIADWHARMCLLQVCMLKKFSKLFCRLFGVDFSHQHHLKREHCANSSILSTELLWVQILSTT